MFDKKDILEYQNIKASQELKDRVMGTYKNSKTPKRIIRFPKSKSLIAACISLVIISSVFLKFGSTSVAIGGTKASQIDSVAQNRDIKVNSYRLADESDIMVPVAIKTIFGTKIHVSSGEISVFSSESGELLFTGSEYSFRGNVIIQWNVTNTEDILKMSVTNKFYDETFKLRYDQNCQNWKISKQ